MNSQKMTFSKYVPTFSKNVPKIWKNSIIFAAVIE